VLALLVFAGSVVWPFTLVLYTIYDGSRYSIQHPHDDAPGMVLASVIYVGAPFVFFAGFLLISMGVALACLKNSLRVNQVG
jgi:hypothetical protein